ERVGEDEGAGLHGEELERRHRHHLMSYAPGSLDQERGRMVELAEPRIVPLRPACARVQGIEEDVFLLRFAADCMTHTCRCTDEGDRPLPDASCQHGADVDLFEKAA